MKRPRPQTNFSTRHLFAHRAFELNLPCGVRGRHTLFLNFISLSFPIAPIHKYSADAGSEKNEIIIYSSPVSHNFTAAQMLIGAGVMTAQSAALCRAVRIQREHIMYEVYLHICFRLPFQTLPCARFCWPARGLSLSFSLRRGVHKAAGANT